MRGEAGVVCCTTSSSPSDLGKPGYCILLKIFQAIDRLGCNFDVACLGLCFHTVSGGGVEQLFAAFD